MRYVLAAAGMIMANSAIANADSNLQLWEEVELRKGISEKWEASVEGHLRLDNNLDNTFALFPEGNIKYRPCDSVEMIGTYRLSRNKGPLRWSTGHRINGDLKLKQNLASTEWVYTFRYQELYLDDSRIITVRNRIELTPDFAMTVKPFAGAETFNQLNNNAGFTRLRLDTGVSLADYKIFYRTEVLRRGNKPDNHIIGIKTGFDL